MIFNGASLLPDVVAHQVSLLLDNCSVKVVDRSSLYQE
jgi:hypothetical protein